EIRRNDAVGYRTDRKLVYAISNPPDIDYGDMVIISNAADGRNYIQTTEVVRTTNTISLENPLPMPELPENVNNAVLLARVESSGSGSDIYHGKVLVWDAANDQLVGPVTLNSVS